MSGRHYPKGEHPYWCDLRDHCAGEEPNHVGRVSQLFVQMAEARVTVELSRVDDTVPAGNVTGDVLIRFGLSRGATIAEADAELTVDEAKAVSLLLAQYVDYAQMEDRRSIHTSRDRILAEGPM